MVQSLFQSNSWRRRHRALPLLPLLVLAAARCAVSARVAVVNGVPFHEGTYASILHALRSLNITDITLFRQHEGRGIDDVMAPWFGARQPGNAVEPYPQFWKSDLCAWDAVIFATSPMDRGHADVDSDDAERRLAACAHGARPRIIMVLHNPRTLETLEGYSMLARLRPAAVLTVAPHTAAFACRALQAAAHGAGGSGGSGSSGGSSGGGGGGGGGGSGGGSVEWTAATATAAAPPLPLPHVDFFVRAFPFFPPGWDAPNRSGLVIQGKLDATRRNYSRVFAELHAGGVPRDSPALPLTLLGTSHGSAHRVAIPDDLRASGQVLAPLVGNKRSLRFGEYYTALAASAALLPAFATEGGHDYFSSKSSSTVPVSLISLTPLVADERLLRAYSFLDHDTVIPVARESLADADAALRGVDYGAVVARLEALRARMLARNARVFADVLGLHNASLHHAA